MSREQLNTWFSEKRFRKFEDHFNGDSAKAEHHYKVNIQLSEALYPILSIFEVCLRNTIHAKLTDQYKSSEWYSTEEWLTNELLEELDERIIEAQESIINRGELVNSDKVVAELTLGFWISLFNTQYERVLWKPLRLCFKHLEKEQRQRRTVSSNLNKIRSLRNRVAHYEPICWSFDGLHENYKRIITTLEWMYDDIIAWSKDIDQFEDVFEDIT